MICKRSSSEMVASASLICAVSAALGHADGDGGVRRVGLKALPVGKFYVGQVGVGGHGAFRAGAFGDVAVDDAGVEGHDHRREGVHGRLLLHVGDLVDHGVVEGVELAGDLRAGEVGKGGGLGVSAVLAHDDDQFALIVGVGEVDGGHALGGGAHAGDDHVDVAGEQRGHQPVPLGLDDLDVVAQFFRHALGDAHVVAVGVAAARKGQGLVACLGLRPVVGRVVALHAHAQRLGAGEASKQHQGDQGAKQSLHGVRPPFLCSVRLQFCRPDVQKAVAASATTVLIYRKKTCIRQ